MSASAAVLRASAERSVGKVVATLVMSAFSAASRSQQQQLRSTISVENTWSCRITLSCRVHLFDGLCREMKNLQGAEGYVCCASVCDDIHRWPQHLEFKWPRVEGGVVNCSRWWVGMKLLPCKLCWGGWGGCTARNPRSFTFRRYLHLRAVFVEAEAEYLPYHHPPPFWKALRYRDRMLWKV